MKLHACHGLNASVLLTLILFAPAIPVAGGTSGSASDSNRYVLTGMVISRDDIWDRRTNPLMGRPDVLQEIRFRISVISNLGSPSPGKDAIEAHVSNREQVIRFKALRVGETGIFTLKGDAEPYSITDFVPVSNKTGADPGNPIASNAAIPAGKSSNLLLLDDREFLKALSKVKGKDILESKALREKIAAVFTRELGMRDTQVVTLVSYQGPRPPKGGYVLWGVRGKIDGEWFIWQGGKLSPGMELDNPHRYQK